MNRLKKIACVCCAVLLAVQLLSCAGAPGAGTGGKSSGAAKGGAGRDLPQYTGKGWKHVKIVGGGFVPGLIFNTAHKGVAYARTDMGGAYRWNPENESWIALTDFANHEEYGRMGISSIATDPVEPNRVIIATGMYTNDWEKGTAVMLVSEDYGETFTQVPVPFKLGGNMPGRGVGERLAIDPNNNKIVYFGSNDAGLWRSEDYGHTWAEVKSFPIKGNVFDYGFAFYAGGFFHFHGIMWVVFDPASGKPGSATQNIYAGVADTGLTLYESNDAGATWHPIKGQPDIGQELINPPYAGVEKGFTEKNPAKLKYDTTKIHGQKNQGDDYGEGKVEYDESGKYYPIKGVYSPAGELLVSYNAGFGPFSSSYQGGAIWKYSLKTKEWTDISLPPHDPDPTRVTLSRGVGSVAVDWQNPKNLVATTLNEWWPDEYIYRSTNGGKSWDPIWYLDGWPNRVNKYRIDVSKAPFLNDGEKTLPEQNPKIGWMITDIEIDPFNSNNMMYVTGGTVFGTKNLTAWDRKAYVDIEVMAEGIEECAVLDLISPPEGPNLISALGDVGGFIHWDLNKPNNKILNPKVDNICSVDYAELKPNVIVRQGSGKFLWSEDFCKTQTEATPIEGLDTGWVGKAAVSADAAVFIWAGKGKAKPVPPMWSTDKGKTWTPCNGIAGNAAVIADRVNPLKFYGYLDGIFYESTDGGKNFTMVNDKFFGDQKDKFTASDFTAVRGMEGELWFAAGKAGLFNSGDGGRTWTLIPGFDDAMVVGLGKGAPGASYQSLYTSAKYKGKLGFWRSDDKGSSWVRINDDKHQYGATNSTITGDARIYGRVYIGTNGRGIVYRDLE